MNARGNAAILATVAVVFGAAVQLDAADLKVENGYTTLFNGKDLTGWKAGKDGKAALDGKTEAFNKRFEVKNGILVANVGSGIQDLYTVKDYNKGFHLKLEFRAAPKADSGVYIRGKQLQVRDYPTVGPYKVQSFKNGDWNQLDIVVQGNKALCKCNGEVLEKAMDVPAKGGIGLQAESGKFEFRRIRVKELE
jgi:hypothetical protein